jgi:hypothetical protein
MLSLFFSRLAISVPGRATVRAGLMALRAGDFARRDAIAPMDAIRSHAWTNACQCCPTPPRPKPSPLRTEVLSLRERAQHLRVGEGTPSDSLQSRQASLNEERICHSSASPAPSMRQSCRNTAVWDTREFPTIST